MNVVTIGNRVPYEYFKTSGFGESDIAIHAGSYHLALKGAGIERANIVTYSSILPKGSVEIEKPRNYVHGEVMECIMSECTGHRNEWLLSGIMCGMLYDRITGEKCGGIVCENSIKGTSSANECDLRHHLKDILTGSLDEIYVNGFFDEYDLRDVSFFVNSGFVNKRYGTSICAICFTSYRIKAFY